MVAKVEVLGVYRVAPRKALLQQAMQVKYGGLPESKSELKEAERHVREELDNLVLIEILVRGPRRRGWIGGLCQPGSDQRAYEESFLSPGGRRVLSRYERGEPKSESVRLAFFLHFFDPGKPLVTPWGDVPLPKTRAMSRRLRRLVAYLPVD
ncbi:MAG TPA: hypothetical protein VI893_06575 [Thermoplasmata archaeon]|nr:hypothetical protein [Thermoplasmata archaeon]